VVITFQFKWHGAKFIRNESLAAQTSRISESGWGINVYVRFMAPEFFL